ncbi:BrnT family toxin [Aureimonas phyllosphaerae]|uniref:BrnT family toxin n=1 Tax=Aureimonas phyllosphaerae TaxID=1166078 RepID=UPI003A5C0980
MRFEYDPEKSISNLAKHGIDFDEAKRLWDDPRLFVFKVQTENELRLIGIGRIGDLDWSAIFTPRNGGIRLISVRRSRKLEVERYEGQ